MAIRSYRDLIVWGKAMSLAASVYRLTRLFPKAEEYRISGQMIRAATSVPANIAEGHGRGTRRDYSHFISIAKGSLAELETFLLLADDLGLAPSDRIRTLLAQADEVGRMLTTLRARLVSRIPGQDGSPPVPSNPAPGT
jgi:four helix bundle protein